MRTIHTLVTRQARLQLLKTSEPLPVDLDDAITWWDCRTKEGMPMRRDQVVRDLKADFIENTDFRAFAPENSGAKAHDKQGGQNEVPIKLSVDCFKLFGMMISGERGKEIRQYFLKCEADLKRLQEEKIKQRNWATVKACVLPKAKPWESFYPPEFWQRLREITGQPQEVCAWLVGYINTAGCR